MIIRCPNGRHSVVVNGLGRKPLNVVAKNVYDILRDSSTLAKQPKT